MKKVLFLTLALVSLSACKKEKFTGRQSFWYKEDVSDELILDNVESLTLYVDGTMVGTVNADEYYDSAPDCKEGHFVYEDKMYRNEVASHTYKVVDDLNYTVWEGSFSTKESLCEAIELVN